jgi:hypothetical protein
MSVDMICRFTFKWFRLEIAIINQSVISGSAKIVQDAT